MNQFCNIHDLNRKANAANLIWNSNSIQSIHWESVIKDTQLMLCSDRAYFSLLNYAQFAIRQPAGLEVGNSVCHSPSDFHLLTTHLQKVCHSPFYWSTNSLQLTFSYSYSKFAIHHLTEMPFSLILTGPKTVFCSPPDSITDGLPLTFSLNNT